MNNVWHGHFSCLCLKKRNMIQKENVVLLHTRTHNVMMRQYAVTGSWMADPDNLLL